MNVDKKLLIVGPSWIGDMVMAQALYRLLWERSPRPEIHVLAPAWSTPLLERMPEVARAIELPVTHGELGFAKKRKLGRDLRHERYGQAIVLPRSWKAALTPYFASIPVRTGFRGEWRYGLINDIRPFDPQRLDQTVKRFVALGQSSAHASLPVIHPPRLRVDLQRQAELMRRHGLGADRPVVALMPGAEYGPAKRWPPERYGELAAGLVREGIEVWVFGSAKERDLGAGVQTLAGHGGVHNLCGATELVDAVDLLAVPAVAVSNDSGLMHVAAAVGTHVVAVYGSSSPGFTPPLTDARSIVYLDLECSPCWQRSCPLRHLRCLRDISVELVASQVREVLRRAPGGSAQ